MSDISNEEEVFPKAAPLYDDALEAGGYTERLLTSRVMAILKVKEKECEQEI